MRNSSCLGSTMECRLCEERPGSRGHGVALNQSVNMHTDRRGGPVGQSLRQLCELLPSERIAQPL